MPLYEYRCTQCHHDFEQQQPVGSAVPACPRCGSPSRRVYSSVGLIFKGSGFHTTDYRKAAPADDGPSKGAASDSAGTKDAKDTKDTKETKETKDTKGAKDTKDTKDTKDAKSSTDTKPTTST